MVTWPFAMVRSGHWMSSVHTACVCVCVCVKTFFVMVWIGIFMHGYDSVIVQSVMSSRLEHIMLFFLPIILFPNSSYFNLLFPYYHPIILMNLF